MFEYIVDVFIFFFFSSRRRHTRSKRDWSSDVCSSDLPWAAISGRSSRSWRSSKSWLLQLVRVRALEARGVGSSAQQLVRRERQEFVEALALGHLLDEARRGR